MTRKRISPTHLRHAAILLLGASLAGPALAEPIQPENDRALLRLRYGMLQAPPLTYRNFPFADASARNEYTLPAQDTLQALRRIDHDPSRYVEFLADRCTDGPHGIGMRNGVGYVWTPLHTASVSATAPASNTAMVSTAVSAPGRGTGVTQTGLGAIYQCTQRSGGLSTPTGTQTAAGLVNQCQRRTDLTPGLLATTIANGRELIMCGDGAARSGIAPSLMADALSLRDGASCVSLTSGDDAALAEMIALGDAAYDCPAPQIGRSVTQNPVPRGTGAPFSGPINQRMDLVADGAPDASRISAETGMDCQRIGTGTAQSVQDNYECWGIVAPGTLPEGKIVVQPQGEPVEVATAETLDPLGPGWVTPYYPRSWFTSSSGYASSSTSSGCTLTVDGNGQITCTSSTGGTTTSGTTTSGTTTSGTTTSGTTTSGTTTSGTTTSGQVPEPGTLALLLAGMWALRRRQQRVP